LDREFLQKLTTEDELIRAFEGKVLDNVLRESAADNKPDNDFSPTATIPAAADIEAIVDSKSGLADLTPSGKTSTKESSESSVTSQEPQPTNDVWAAFSESDFQAPVHEDFTEAFDDELSKEALEGEWQWLTDTSKPIYLNSEDKKTLRFPSCPANLDIGHRIPVYCPALGRQMDHAMYIVKTGVDAWGRLNYNAKPHRNFLSDRTEPMSDEWLKAETEAGSFIIPNKDNVEVVRDAYNRILALADGYGMKPAAAVVPPRTPVRGEREDFVKPLPTEGLETHWMSIFTGEEMVKHQLKRAKGGSKFAMMKYIHSSYAIRVIVQKNMAGKRFDVFDEDMNFKVALDEENFFADFEKRTYFSPEEEHFTEATKALQDRINVSIRRDNERLDVSPKRAALRDAAFRSMQHQAAKMMKYAGKKEPECQLGDCVQIPLKWMDTSRLDGGYLVGVVVRVTVGGKLQIACKAGVIDHCFSRSHVTKLTGVSNDRKLNNLEEVFREFEGIPKVTVRHAARHVSQTGGQGIQRCNCTGNCSNNRCRCRKTSVKCGNHCKCKVEKCCNRED